MDSAVSEMLWIANACRGGAMDSRRPSGGAIDSAEHFGDATDGAGRLGDAAVARGRLEVAIDSGRLSLRCYR